MTVRVAIIDDQNFVREGLISLFSRNDHLQLVNHAANHEMLAEINDGGLADVVVINHDPPALNAVEIIRKIKEMNAAQGVVVLTRFYSRQYILPLLQTGAGAVVVKTAGTDEIVDAIVSVAEGKSHLSDAIQTELVRDLQKRADNDVDQLTERETQVLAMIAQGMRSRDIAEALEISVKTVDKARTVLMSKLKMQGIAQLTRYAIQTGLVTLY